MDEITIRAKNLRNIIQKAKDLHTRNVKITISHRMLNASISGTDNKGNDSEASISLKQEAK